ncbi:SUMF1/EgtB/PvdO family nonheme iron enzyme [Enterobacter roggenkampii]
MSQCKKIIITFISGVVLIGCDNAKGNASSEKQFADEIVNSMISVKGGRFQMGDFGPLVGEKMPFSPEQNNKPLHLVELSDFKITKYKVTWGNFNKWIDLTGKNKNQYYLWATKKVQVSGLENQQEIIILPQ